MRKGCEYFEGGLCEAFARSSSAFKECEMPDGLPEPCPLAVSQTGDMPFTQAVTKYRDIVAKARLP
ncbi:hypothetical protein M1437_02240 [Patescibacteria group bacterium]|nr:hypothetical protein [Patescibacteria group bacterium]